MHFATGPDDTGVIIAYNTQAPAAAAGANILILPGALVINPITWTTDETLATTAEGLDSYMPNSAGVFSPVPQYADARVDLAKGALICSTADKSLGFGQGIFHIYDYSFNYFNLRANASNRVQKFLKK